MSSECNISDPFFDLMISFSGNSSWNDILYCVKRLDATIQQMKAHPQHTSPVTFPDEGVSPC